MARWWLVLMFGCNQVYGLDPTTVREPITDLDEDGVDDDIDNCLGVANNTQADVDDDGKGDACDGCTGCKPCEMGADHDEDGDLEADGCDNCPTVPNPMQTNTDGDDLGNDCDASNTTMQRRALFDGFGTIADTWARIGEWTAAGDAAEATQGANLFGARLTDARAIIDGTKPWTLELAFDVPAIGAAQDAIGGSLVATDDGRVIWQCTIVWDVDTGWNLTNGIPAPVTLAAGPTVMTMSSQRGGTTERYCRVPNNPEKQNGAFNELYPLGVQLHTTRAARYRWIEVIQ